MTHALPPIERLKAIMARLRDRKDGCPWDTEQTFATIAGAKLVGGTSLFRLCAAEDAPSRFEGLAAA